MSLTLSAVMAFQRLNDSPLDSFLPAMIAVTPIFFQQSQNAIFVPIAGGFV
jgi:hypothetical protein